MSLGRYLISKVGGRKFWIWIIATVLYSVKNETFGAEAYQWVTMAFMASDAVDKGITKATGELPESQGLGFIPKFLGGRRMMAFYVTTGLAFFAGLPGDVWTVIAVSATGAYALEEIPSMSVKLTSNHYS